MSNELQTGGQPAWVQLLSKLLILMGMFTVGLFFFTMVGFQLCPYLFGVNLAVNDNLAENLKNESYVSAYRFVQYLYSLGAFALPALAFAQYFAKDKKYDFIGLGKKASWALVGFSLLLGLCYYPLLDWIYQLNRELSLTDSLKEMEKQNELLTQAFLKGSGLNHLFANLLLMALLPAFCEELFFRGALQGYLSHWSGKPHVAIWVSAFIFSALHMEFLGFVPRLLMGAYLGYMYAWSGSLWVSILGHFFHNGLAIFAVWLGHNGFDTGVLAEEYHFPLWSALVSAAFTAGLIYWFKKYTDRQKVPF